MKTYFITDGARVKIGRSANPQQRLESLQTYNALPLTMLLILDDDRELELHHKFAVHRIRGEWFRLTHPIREFISSHTKHALHVPFYEWLMEQRNRCDDVGRMAVIVASDNGYPRHQVKLRHHLDYYSSFPALREVLRLAHREWRNLVKPNDTRAKRLAS